MKTLLITSVAILALVVAGCAARPANDLSITDSVKGKLAADSEMSRLRINVETTDGVVTLSGTVATAAEKSKAEQIARNTEGVMRVVNNITINPEMREKTGEAARPMGEAIADATILSKIKTKLVGEGLTGANIEVINGEVTLKGEVTNAEEKAQAEELARTTEGVKSVNNRLTVKRY
jgi:osmotically-inducible protein OsmY